MKKTKLICLILLTAIGIGKAQNYTISGYITDDKSGETFISASVYDSNTKKRNCEQHVRILFADYPQRRSLNDLF